MDLLEVLKKYGCNTTADRAVYHRDRLLGYASVEKMNGPYHWLNYQKLAKGWNFNFSDTYYDLYNNNLFIIVDFTKVPQSVESDNRLIATLICFEEKIKKRLLEPAKDIKLIFVLPSDGHGYLIEFIRKKNALYCFDELRMAYIGLSVSMDIVSKEYWVEPYYNISPCKKSFLENIKVIYQKICHKFYVLKRILRIVHKKGGI